MDEDQLNAAARFRQFANVTLVTNMADFNRPGEVLRILPELSKNMSWEFLAMDGDALASCARVDGQFAK